MRLVHLVYAEGSIRKIVCGFYSSVELHQFLNPITLELLDKLPTVNPSREPILVFETALEATRYLADRYWWRQDPTRLELLRAVEWLKAEKADAKSGD